MNKPIFIAEIKTQSPFGYKSEYPFSTLMDCALQFGDWISVHDNALWGGDYESISFIKGMTKKPILAKGLHSTTDSILKAFEYGADYVLTVNNKIGTALAPCEDRIKLNKYNDRILFETDFQNAEQYIDFNPSFMSRKYVCNQRDLRTGLLKKDYDLNSFIRKGVWVCQASGIKTPNDVHPYVKAFIVGEHLMNFCFPNK